MTGDVAAVMARYGGGQLTAQQAAQALRPLLVTAAPSPRSVADFDPDPPPDDAPGGYGGYGDVAYALHSGVITMAQYAALVPLIAGSL